MNFGRRWTWSKERRNEDSNGDAKPGEISIATA